MTKIILIGPLTEDTIYLDKRVIKNIGGTVFYAAETFNKFNCEVLLIPILPKKKIKYLNKIHSKISIKPIFSNNNLLFQNIYSKKNIFERKQKLKGYISTKENININKIKNIAFQDSNLIFIGPQTNNEISLKIIKIIYRQNKNICLHAQGFFREFSQTEISEKTWKGYKLFLKYLRTIILSEKQIYSLNNSKSFIENIQELNRLGPKEIIITRGNEGFTVFADNKFFSVKYPQLSNKMNPNGITGTFAAAFISERLIGKSLRDSALLAMQTTYVKMNSVKPLHKTRHQILKMLEIQKILEKWQ
jgi:hypothetical protein